LKITSGKVALGIGRLQNMLTIGYTAWNGVLTAGLRVEIQPQLTQLPATKQCPK
jgi:hypothetical protein